MSGASAGWVLVVDDSAAGRYAVSRMLRRGGYEVREAGTGQEALRLAAEKPRLVLLDVHLPDVDGHEVCRRLRSDPSHPRSPHPPDVGQLREGDRSRPGPGRRS